MKRRIIISLSIIGLALVSLTSFKPFSRCQHLNSFDQYDCYNDAAYNSPFCFFHQWNK